MLKKDDREHPIPPSWRPMFRLIADAFVAGDFALRRHLIAGVATVPAETATQISINVAAYGDVLAPLDDATWERSIYLWTGGYWQVLVDLSTASEAVSDLTLHAELYEEGDFSAKVCAVYVP